MHSLINEAILRLSTFGGVLLLLLLAEAALPRRQRTRPRRRRWMANFGLVVLNTVVARLLLPFSVAGVALMAEEYSWGWLHRIDCPGWLEIVLAFVVLDLVIYLQHVLFHAVPLLWRLHRVHHADRDVDASTGVRFHTLEILLSLGIKVIAVVVLGAPALAVLLFEIMLNATSLFNHANLRLPTWLDRVLRLVLVTPDMHRVHHSLARRETNSNFGFNLPWWDCLFGTYRAQPAAGHETMLLGLEQFQDESADSFGALLVMPFRESADGSEGPSVPQAVLPPGSGSLSASEVACISSVGWYHCSRRHRLFRR